MLSTLFDLLSLHCDINNVINLKISVYSYEQLNINYCLNYQNPYKKEFKFNLLFFLNRKIIYVKAHISFYNQYKLLQKIQVNSISHVLFIYFLIITIFLYTTVAIETIILFSILPEILTLLLSDWFIYIIAGNNINHFG